MTSTTPGVAEDLDLSTEDALAVFDSIDAATATASRNRALIVALWRIGMRPGEALSVRGSDIDLSRGAITMGNRLIALDPMSIEVFSQWQARRDELGLPADGPFLSTLRGGALAQAYVRELLPRLAENAGVTVRMHGMGLRYLCAREMVAEGISLDVIQQQLDAWSQSSVSRFLPRPSDEQVLAEIGSRRAPRT